MNKDNAKQFDDLTMNWIKYKWLWIFIFLTLLGLLDIGVLVTDDMADGNQVEWLRYFINEISAVWLLLPLIAVLFWFFRQYPITKSNFKSRLLLHLFVTVLFGTTHTLLMYTIRTPLYHWFGIGAYNSFYGILGYRIVMEYLKQFIFIGWFTGYSHYLNSSENNNYNKSGRRNSKNNLPDRDYKRCRCNSIRIFIQHS